MPKYVIEREIPDVGNLTPEQVLAISQKSCSVLRTWDHRFSGSRATSRRTKFTVSILLPTKRWCGNMLNKAVSPRIGFRK